MRKAIGYILVSSPAIALAYFVYIDKGAKAVFEVFGTVALMCGIIYLGFKLIYKD